MQPLEGCTCNWCEQRRAEQGKIRDRLGIGPRPFGPAFGAGFSPFIASAQELADRLKTIGPVPFEPEAAEAAPAPDPAYTHVLVDYDEAGDLDLTYAELHTAESLVEAIALRKDQDEGFKVFLLGESILDVSR